MASIGELFKFLGANELFQGLCQNAEKTNQQIIETVFQNDEVITTLKTFVQDETVIRSKIDILIGQKRKNQNKKQEQVKQEQTEEKQQQVDQDQDKEEVRSFKSAPINPLKVVYLDSFAFVEQIGNTMRLVTHDYEMYY